MKRTVFLTLALLGAVTVISGCRSKHYDEVDLTGIHTTAASTAAKETLASSLPETTAAPIEETTTAASSGEQETEGVTGISTQTETYSLGSVSIQYPVISGMTDAVRQDKVNQLLKDNAQAFVNLQQIDEAKDKVSVKCKVVSADRRRITSVFTGTYTPSGAASPTKVFYTSTVDLEQVKNLGLNDYTDGYTMAGYLLSDDCQFQDVSANLKASLLEYRSTQTLEDYTKLLEAADLSTVKSGADAAFPQSFSYTDQGVLYFSIPVPHELGDYAVVTFHLDGK